MLFNRNKSFFLMLMFHRIIDSSSDNIIENDKRFCATSWSVNCDCEKTYDIWRFYCPAKNNSKITIHAISHSFLVIDCETLSTSRDYEAISSINFQRINRINREGPIFSHSKLTFRNCSIPLNGFHDIVRNLTVSKSENILGLKNCQPEPDHTFQREHFADFDEFKWLELKNAEPIKISSNAFENTSKITFLRINIPHMHLPANLFDNLNGLERLKLHNTVTGLDGELFRNQRELQELQLVAINSQNLTKEFFRHLSSVGALGIDHTQMTTISPDLFDLLPKVETVSLEENNFTSLPAAFLSANKHIAALTIRDIKLKTLPIDLLANRRRLGHFVLTYTSVERIHVDMFKDTTLLQRLEINDNELSDLPIGVFRNLDKLLYLNLANNKITKLPENILSGLYPIQYIYLNENLLADCPNFTNFPTNVQLLDLSSNRIERVTSNNLRQLSSSVLDLTNNTVVTIDFDDITSTLASLASSNKTIRREVKLHNNPIRCDDRLGMFAHYLEYPNNLFKITVEGRCVTPHYLARKQLSEIDMNDVSHQSPNFGKTKCPIGCDCYYRRSDLLFVMICTKIGLRELTRFPAIREAPYKFIELNFYNQNVTEFPDLNRLPGSGNVRSINASYNNINSIPLENWLGNLKMLDLSHNKLIAIDKYLIRKMKASNSLREIRLSGNPWQCNCSTQELRSFIYSDPTKVPDNRQIQCENMEGKLLREVDDLCVDIINIAIMALFICVLFISLVTVIFYKYEEFIKYWLYANNCCLWFIDEDDLDRDKQYDAFVSYAEEDRDFVFDTLIPALEDGPEKYRLCVHTRDWISAPIIEQIYESVLDSRRTIIILSGNFLKSHWSLTEFRAAHEQAISERRFRVIIIIYGDIDLINDLDLEMQAYLRTNTYLKWGDALFLDKLRYSLRRSRTNRQQNACKVHNDQ